MAESYSVWALCPPAHPGLQQTVQHLRKIYGGPEFESHVTVVGGVDMPLDQAVAKLQKLVRSLAPTTYRINGVGRGDTYYQSVFLTVDPTAPVLEANAQAKIAFELPESQQNAPYFPHLSLIYGDLKDENKTMAVALAEEKFGNTLVGSEFVVSSLSLWATDTEDKLLTSWKKVAEYPLESGS